MKKKKNKKKKAKEDNLNNEDVLKLDIDALINYIQNPGAAEGLSKMKKKAIM